MYLAYINAKLIPLWTKTNNSGLW